MGNRACGIVKRGFLNVQLVSFHIDSQVLFWRAVKPA
jgi:hypothetical protein